MHRKVLVEDLCEINIYCVTYIYVSCRRSPVDSRGVCHEDILHIVHSVEIYAGFLDDILYHPRMNIVPQHHDPLTGK